MTEHQLEWSITSFPTAIKLRNLSVWSKTALAVLKHNS